ncbi:PREDICTED: suppressor of IKBKE 1 isoform X1 [Thamnophis sirtalis]|uniref:Suppressor of IKBKE 1 n=2 Tax=Thamnophis sirtalis TaxID=35019 RepID=A0A6I9X6S9_9SAUR|nr:PREDICTED: suppressor of IKBKE 1 isoform X1 [Thamnophis sirtalis]
MRARKRYRGEGGCNAVPRDFQKKMACTIEKILTDAKTLLERLKDHDNAAETLIDQSTMLHKKVVAMKEAGSTLSHKYQEDAAELKDLSKYKPHILLSQENTQIRDLQQENRELWISLEEHQDALELIMSKYRKHMLQLMMKRKDMDSQSILQVHQTQSAEIESQIDIICEMGEVMRKAVNVDSDQYYKIQEKLAQLELENKELRKLLSISKESVEVRQELLDVTTQATKPQSWNS